MQRRRVIAIVAAVVLALVGTVIIVAYVQSVERRALAGETLVRVLVAAERIDENEPATGLEGRTRVEDVPERLVQQGAVETVAELGDQVTMMPILPGHQIRRAQFGEPGEVGGGQSEIDPSQELLTIALERQRALDGKLQAGDEVGVLVSLDQDTVVVNANGETQPAKTATGMVLQGILVNDVRGGVVQNADETAEASEQVVLTLVVDSEDAETIVYGQEFGSVWLTRQGDEVPPLDDKTRHEDNIFRDISPSGGEEE